MCVCGQPQVSGGNRESVVWFEEAHGLGSIEKAWVLALAMGHLTVAICFADEALASGVHPGHVLLGVPRLAAAGLLRRHAPRALTVAWLP